MARQVRQPGRQSNSKSRNAEAAPQTREALRDEAVSLRRAILWSAAAFLAVAVAGLLLAPGLGFLWVVLLIFGIAAVPQAFRRSNDKQK